MASFHFKQEYLYQQAPFKTDFHSQRQQVFQQIISLLARFRINSWGPTGLDFFFLIQRYKMVYGLTSFQIESLLTLFSNMLFTQEKYAVQTRGYILKTCNYLMTIRTKLNHFTVRNALIFAEYKRLADSVLVVPMKHLENYIEELNCFTSHICKYGEDSLLEALAVALENKQIKYLSLFVRSAKSESNAKKILAELFCLSGSWERDCHWFFVLCQLTKRFPQLDYCIYFHTLFQEIIKNLNGVLSPISDPDLERIIMPDDFTTVPSIFKSMAVILVNLIVPDSQPHSVQVWTYIQRIFTLIITTIDPLNQTPQVLELIKFLRIFIKNFLKRIKKQSGLNITVNQDYVETAHFPCANQQYHIDQYSLNKFNQLCELLIPKLLFLEQNDCKIPKIILELVSFDQRYIDLVFSQCRDLLYKEDEVSLLTTKMVLLFISEYIIVNKPNKLDLLLSCVSRMLQIVDKLGLADHLDIVELVIRMYIFLPDDHFEIQNIKTDLLDIIIDNLDVISSVLQNSDNTQAELYIDIKNIFFPLFLKMDGPVLDKFVERFVFKTTTAIPHQTQTYQLLLIILSYRCPALPNMIMPPMLKQILKPIVSEKYHFLPELPTSLHSDNEQNIKWYSMVIQCTYQYQPSNAVRDFHLLEPVLINMMKSDNTVIFQSGCDILHNLIICVAINHISDSQFRNTSNNCYSTLKLDWIPMTSQQKQFIQHILKKYVYDLMDFVYDRYKSINVTYNNSELLDSILVPKIVGNHALEEKKILTKVISIQQCVISALLPRTPIDSPNESQSVILRLLKSDMIEELSQLRLDTIVYMNKLMGIMHELQIISEPALIKIYYFLYNQIHGECYISDLIQPTEQKLSAFRTQTVQSQNNIYTSSFLIINQLILLYNMRIDLLTALYPTAQKSNPLYMSQLMLLSHHSALSITNRSFFDCPQSEFHQYHIQVIELWWSKLDYSNPNSYFRLMQNQNNQNRKERYKHAIATLIMCLKKIATYLTMECCVQDNTLRRMLFGFATIYAKLEKKKEKTWLVQTLFTLFSFQFDNTLIIAQPEHSLWQREHLENRFATTHNQYIKYVIERTPVDFSTKQNNNQETYKCIHEIIRESIDRLSKKPSKEQALYSLYSLIYLPFISKDDPIFSEVFMTFQKLAKRSESEISQMGRVGIFHIINQFRKRHTTVTLFPNTARKISFEMFTRYRTFGCPEGIDVKQTSCKKYQNTFQVSSKIKYKYTTPLSQLQTKNINEVTILAFLTDSERLSQLLSCSFTDKELIEETDQEYDLNKMQTKGVIMQSQRLLNYLFDRDPKKINIFASFIDNFSLYTSSFYPRFLKKMLQVGGPPAVATLERVGETFRLKQQKEAKKLYAYISMSLLAYPISSNYLQTYLNQICSCANDLFITHLGGLYYLFRRNPFTVRPIYKILIDKLRAEKGPARLRHIELWKIFVVGQGRWGRQEAVEGLEWLLEGGINEASDEVAEAIVTAIVECFTLPLNLQIFKQWVEQPVYDLVKSGRLFKLNGKIGFQIHPKLTAIFKLITTKIEEQKQYESTNMKIYTKVASKIIENLTVYQFNDFFYEMLAGIIKHLIEKSLDDINESEIIRRLGESEYPNNIFNKLVSILQDLNNFPLVTVKKKLKYIETLMLCSSFSNNRMIIPNILDKQSSITIHHILTVANILKVSTPEELTTRVQNLLNRNQLNVYPLMMSCLLAAGNFTYQWKEDALKKILTYKSKKLVKEFVSVWWKGKGEGLYGEEALARLVKNVENPYNYFA